MAYKIIGDSCTDLTKEQRNDKTICLVPLSIEIDGHRIEDDETFDQADFLVRVAQSPNCPKSSCPAPEAYMKMYEGDEDCYVVTLSERLSGSYNSAVLGKNLYLEEHTNKNIHVFNSLSASCGQTLIVMKIKELAEQGKPFEEVVKETEAFIQDMSTKFVLESLDTLRKNGRLTNIQAIFASALNIKPIMAGNKNGEIEKIDQARGINRALKRMIELIERDVKNPENRILAIAHCNNKERAEYVKEELLSKIPFKDCFITDTNGISSLYANDGGIVVCY